MGDDGVDNHGKVADGLEDDGEGRNEEGETGRHMS